MSASEISYRNILYRKAKGSLVLSARGLTFRLDGTINTNGAANRVVLPWARIAKHQVSPASHAKSLLKVIAAAAAAAAVPAAAVPAPGVNGVANGGGGGVNGGSTAAGGGADKAATSTAYTFVFPDRGSLEGARRDITARLAKLKGGGVNGKQPGAGNKKRPRAQSAVNNELAPKRQSTPPSSHYIAHDPIALISTRSSLLASDPALRAQHRLLVLDGVGTLTEEDFWETHSRLVANEYAKISGKTNRGMSSDIKSSLDLGISNQSKKGAKKGGGGAGGAAQGGIVHLGVEEMRQIFLMYPAVHRAYEEKVPLELSEEQFWRKYLESEYFHRDRGRIGAHIGKVNERELIEQERVLGKKADEEEKDKKKKEDKDKEETMGEEEAKSRLAAAGTDDIFSRYDPKGQQLGGGHGRHHHRQQKKNRQLGVQIAVGQFDLASTNEGERGDRFLQLKDMHPPPEKDSAGARVVDKYNRHWAIVLHPSDITAGVDLKRVAAMNAKEDLARAEEDADDDAKVNGGCDREMRRLIGFANADECDADFARGVGDNEDLMELHLNNIDAYTGKFGSDPSGGAKNADDAKRHLKFAKFLALEMRRDTESILREKTAGKSKGFCHAPTLTKPLPDPMIGRGLMGALTKKMAADSQTEADVQQLADTLPEDFRNKLATFFRRASELLRHFFSLRSVYGENSDENGGTGQSEAQKDRLMDIVKGMEAVHGEMKELKRDLPLMESKMFNPIMDQLDWAFKLHREDSTKSKGGFVTVAKGGFAPVAF